VKEPLVSLVLLAGQEELEQEPVAQEQQRVSLAQVSQRGRPEPKPVVSLRWQGPQELQALAQELAQPLLEVELPLGLPHRSHQDLPADHRSPWGVHLACHHGQMVALVVEHQVFLVGRPMGSFQKF
jgi:hypothetical protein